MSRQSSHANPTVSFFLKIVVATGAVIATVLLLNSMCFVLLSLGVQGRTPFRYPASNSPRPLLPFEIPQSLTRRPVYDPIVEPPPRLGAGAEIRIEEHHRDDSDEGLRHVKNFRGRTSAIEVKNGITIFDHDVIIDGYGRRISRPLQSRRDSQKHLLLLGCSYVFGTGVDNEQTVTWHINTLQNEYEAYNNGIGGSGTGDILRQMQSGEAVAGVTQKKGIAIYNMISGHIHRAVNSTSVGPWVSALAAFRETPDHRFEYLGSFRKAFPLKTAVYGYLAETALFRFFGIHLPVLTAADLERQARMIARTRDSYLAQTDKDNLFVVAIYPQPVTDIDIDVLRKALSREKVYFIDYSLRPIDRYFPESIRIPYDGHPNGFAHRLYAEVLLEDIPTADSPLQ